MSNTTLETPGCELVPAAEAAMKEAIHNYNSVMSSIPAFAIGSLGAETKVMKEAEEYLESRKKFWNDCVSMCMAASKEVSKDNKNKK